MSIVQRTCEELIMRRILPFLRKNQAQVSEADAYRAVHQAVSLAVNLAQYAQYVAQKLAGEVAGSIASSAAASVLAVVGLLTIGGALVYKSARWTTSGSLWVE
jgi:hypothetical protein